MKENYLFFSARVCVGLSILLISCFIFNEWLGMLLLATIGVLPILQALWKISKKQILLRNSTTSSTLNTVVSPPPISKFRYVWAIKNFSLQKEDLIKSPIFSAGIDNQQQWCLRIFPKGIDHTSVQSKLKGSLEECDEHYVSLFLMLISNSGQPEVRIKFRFSLLNTRGQEKFEMHSERGYRFVQYKDWGFKKFIRQDFLMDNSNEILLDDELIVVCEGEEKDVVSSSTESFEIPKGNLRQDISSLYMNKNLSDVLLVVDTKEFPAHRAILAARSKVFAAMFSQPSQENVSTMKIKMDDMTDAVLGNILKYIYTETVPRNLANLPFLDALHGAADKYGLPRLKALCEEALCLSLTNENVSTRSTLADLHNATILKKKTIEFVQTQASEIEDKISGRPTCET